MAKELIDRERKIGKMHGRKVKLSEALTARYKGAIKRFLGKKRRKVWHFTLGELTRALKVKEHGHNVQLITFLRALNQLQDQGVLEEYDHPAEQGMKAYRLKPDDRHDYEERPD